MHSHIYSCLFCAANIKQENIIDSHAALTEVNVVTSLQIKDPKTHLLFVSALKLRGEDETLYYNKKAQSLLRLLSGLHQVACNEWT